MTRDIIAQIWESEGAKLSGHTLAIREEREASCFVSTPGEVMSIAKVTKVELRDGFVVLQTAKDERYAEADRELYRALRLDIIAAQREALLAVRDEGTFSASVLTGALETLDADQISMELRREHQDEA